jgi:hypothetical protein
LDLSHDSKDGNVDIFNKLSKPEYAGNGYDLQGDPVAFCGVLSQDNHPNHSEEGECVATKSHICAEVKSMCTDMTKVCVY